MSDFEDDEMDVDRPEVQDAIRFSSSNTEVKGKRSAANLPVEAEDTLPWYGRDQLHMCVAKAECREGWKSTDPTHWMMYPATKTY